MKTKRYFALVGLSSLCAVTLLGGCSTILLFDPKGPIGEAERFVIIAAIVLMLIVVIPVFIMAFWFPESTELPILNRLICRNGVIPLKSISSCGRFLLPLSRFLRFWPDHYPLSAFPISLSLRPTTATLEAVSLDRKWLFIYPDLKSQATVNQISFPVDVLVSFKLTSETVMTSFFSRNLAARFNAMEA